MDEDEDEEEHVENAEAMDVQNDQAEETEAWQEVLEEMTRAVLLEERQLARAIEASRASEEDGQVRGNEE